MTGGPTPVNIPKLGVSMTEAVLSSWVAADGDPIAPGQVICVIETDKVEQEIEAPVGGTLIHRGQVGDTYQVGELVAEIR